MKMKCFTAEDILMLQHQLIRDLCMWDWIADGDKEGMKLAAYIQGVSDMTAELLNQLEAENEQ